MLSYVRVDSECGQLGPYLNAIGRTSSLILFVSPYFYRTSTQIWFHQKILALYLLPLLKSTGCFPLPKWKCHSEKHAYHLVTELSIRGKLLAVLQRSWEKGWQRPLSDQRMAVTELSGTNQNPEVSKRITSGPVGGGRSGGRAVSSPASLATLLGNELECPQANSNRCYRLERPVS